MPVAVRPKTQHSFINLLSFNIWDSTLLDKHIFETFLSQNALQSYHVMVGLNRKVKNAMQQRRKFLFYPHASDLEKNKRNG